MAHSPDPAPQPNQGQLLARGVARHLASLNFASLPEFCPARGLRVDVCAIGPKSEIWVFECKSGLADYRADHKWHNYLPYADRFFFAVDLDFPTEILPPETGLCIADPYGAEIIRLPDEAKLPPARRKKLLLKFARDTAIRLRQLTDPSIG